MFIQMCIAEMLKALQMGMTSIVAAYLVQQQILQDREQVETLHLQVFMDSRYTMHQQMVNSAIFFHYYNAHDKSIGDIPPHEDNLPMYYRHPTTITSKIHKDRAP
jgi:hypothetical protein